MKSVITSLIAFVSTLALHAVENPSVVNPHVKTDGSVDFRTIDSIIDSMWQKRYSHLLAEKPDGEIWQMPINHMATGIPSPKALKRDGLLVLGYDVGNNPAFEFVGETADCTSISVCNWGYDVHFIGHYTRDELYAPLCPQFRIRLCPDDKVLQMQAAAEPVPPVG